MQIDWTTAGSVMGWAALLAGGILMVFSRIPKQTISNQKALIEAQEGRIAALEAGRQEDGQALAELRGQVNVLRDIPLADLANSYKQTVETQKQIIELIKDMRTK